MLILVDGRVAGFQVIFFVRFLTELTPEKVLVSQKKNQANFECRK